MVKNLEIAVRWFLALIILSTIGCVSRNAPPVNYYSLLSAEQLGIYRPLAEMQELNFGIGPISLVESLRRSQIVTRTADNVYTFDEYNKWAAPLEKDLAMTLGSDLSYFTGAGGVDYFPWLSYFQPTHRIVVNVERLDGQIGVEAILHARWNVLAADGKTILFSGTLRRKADATGESYAEMVRLESMLVAELAREIARTVIE